MLLLAQQEEKATDEMAKAGRARPKDVLQAKVARLQVEIELERARGT
jgi:outer membrane protein TolC